MRTSTAAGRKRPDKSAGSALCRSRRPGRDLAVGDDIKALDPDTNGSITRVERIAYYDQRDDPKASPDAFFDADKHKEDGLIERHELRRNVRSAAGDAPRRQAGPGHQVK